MEVSALRTGPHATRAYVEFAASALGGADDVELTTWSVRRLRRAERGDVTPRRTLRARMAARAASMGVPISASWAAPTADVIFEASGALRLGAAPPAVITVHRVAPPRDAASRREWEQLRRAVDAGVVLHVLTSALGDQLVAEVGIPRDAVMVAAPGVRVAPPTPATATGAPRVLVLRGASAAREVAILEALQAAGIGAERADEVTAAATCCVLAAPDATFPLAAFESLVAGVPVVAARTPTTTELLQGSAVLVDAAATQEFVDAAMELCGNDAARAVVVAAGRARADDFSWARRTDALVRIVRRAAQRR